ncbi:unnamed protein product [Acanthoscelides obtectus]|uniref:Uncharacterized protein n=1 Tax=Acanthoscelides obtectus TaxID=200917 RepID=A0A9P0LMA4_ACAOB|nr:unnamed protein product [Acanthoscelides obtectus]CAK1677140.1 hypothetical protein AOBTE_LOCUS31134 [Acanthoscelides obtectus]
MSACLLYLVLSAKGKFVNYRGSTAYQTMFRICSKRQWKSEACSSWNLASDF